MRIPAVCAMALTWGHMSCGHAVTRDMLLSVITERVYPTQPLDRIGLLPDGRAASAPARVWEMRSVFPQP